jgi:hypothetical protein
MTVITAARGRERPLRRTAAELTTTFSSYCAADVALFEALTAAAIVARNSGQSRFSIDGGSPA